MLRFAFNIMIYLLSYIEIGTIMRLKIEDMVMFSKVAEKLSFMNAATELNIPQSTLSRRIRLFEEELNIPLFDRSKRQVTLSKEGEEVLAYCREIVDKKNELESFIESTYHTNSGKLTIVASSTISQNLSAGFLDFFFSRHPNISIEFQTIYDGYSYFNGDILLTCVLPKDESLIATKFSSEEKTFFASSAYLKKHGVPKSIDDLLQHKILCVKNPFYPDINQSYPDVGFDNSSNKIVYSDISQALYAALKGGGVLWATKNLVATKVESGKLNVLFDGNLSVELSGYAVYKPRFIQPNKITSFINEIKNYVASLDVVIK